MPEDLGEIPIKIGDQYRQLRQEGQIFDKPDIKNLVESFGAEYIGAGCDCVVISTKDKPEKVVAINYRDLNPEIAKQIFYRQRILSTLFPHNFPHFYASIAGKDSYGGTVRQRINGASLDEIEEKGIISDPEGKVKYPFGKVIEVCRQIGIPLSVDTQDDKNFVLGEDGGVYYLDSPEEAFPGKWDEVKITEYMKNAQNENGGVMYDENDRIIVEKSIKRIQNLKR